MTLKHSNLISKRNRRRRPFSATHHEAHQRAKQIMIHTDQLFNNSTLIHSKEDFQHGNSIENKNTDYKTSCENDRNRMSR